MSEFKDGQFFKYIKHKSLGSGWWLDYCQSNPDMESETIKHNYSSPPYFYQISGLDSRNMPSIFVSVGLVDGVLTRDVDLNGKIIRDDYIPNDIWKRAEEIIKNGW